MHTNYRDLGLLLLALGWISTSHAQTLYRCGKTYQDRPCDGPVEGAVVGTGVVTAKPHTIAIKTDAFCTQQGADALKVMWAKEGGRTEQEQTAEARAKGGSPDFIHYVYGKRGSATEVRGQIETDCTADQERKAQAASLANAANALAGQTAPTSKGVETSGQVDTTDKNISRESETNQSLRRKTEQCNALRDQVDTTKATQRTGGSAAAMELLNRKMHDLEAQRHSLGC